MNQLNEIKAEIKSKLHSLTDRQLGFAMIELFGRDESIEKMITELESLDEEVTEIRDLDNFLTDIIRIQNENS